MFLYRAAVATFLLAVPAAAIPCGPNTSFKATGSANVAGVAQAWATAYGKACGNSISVSSAADSAGGGSIAGAKAVCAGTTDIGLLNRQFKSTEATQNSKNPYLYTCANGNKVTEVQVAIDGLAFLAAPSGIAAKCIVTLTGGGLSFSQVRFMFSSFTLSKLKADATFDGLAVPNSDGNDNTRLWSELCSGAGCNCPATPIGIAGSPSTSGTYLFFDEKILTGSGETVRSGFLSDPTDSSTFVVNTVTASGNSATIGFTSFAPYNNNANKVYAASVLDPDDGVYRFPTYSQFSSGEYPASFTLYFEVDNSILPTVQDFFVYAFSDAGNTDVLNTGLLPLSQVQQVQQLSRVGASGGVNLATVANSCGTGGALFQGGSSVLYPLSYLWGNVYGDACGLSVKTIAGGTTLGVNLACGIPDPVSRETADIGTITRLFATSEAVVQTNTYDYKCVIGTKRTVRQFPVAIDGITLAFPLGGVSAKCIASLPGNGLTIDQLRWMYSNYNFAQLVANGWDKTSLPNSDGNDSTHLWSELGGSGCAAQEIAISGPSSSSGTYTYFVGKIFSGTGETIALTRPLGYYNNAENNFVENVQYLQKTPASIGYLGYSYYATNTNILGAATIKNSKGTYVFPTEATLADFSYNPFARFVYFELSTVFLTFQKTVAFTKWGITTPIGDTLTRLSGFAPLSSTTKATLTARYTLSVPCFSEVSTVQVLNKGLTAMKDLKIGDKVMNAQGKFDAVYSFGHYAPGVEAEFIQIHATGLKKPLEISKEHMLFVDGAAVPASAVSVGDKVNLAAGGVAEVKKILSVVRHGAYAPFTKSGTIAVNDVAASVYVDLQNNAGVLVIGGYKTPLTMQFLAHMFQAPHRLACAVSPSYCQTETYDDSGVSSWVAGPLAIAEWLIKQNMVVMTLAFVPSFLLGVAVYAFEVAFTSKMLLLVAIASALFLRSTKKAKKEA
jgi:ABC-type phosphate transport system substrate-binding protein